MEKRLREAQSRRDYATVACLMQELQQARQAEETEERVSLYEITDGDNGLRSCLCRKMIEMTVCADLLYLKAMEFQEALRIIPTGNKVAMFLRLQFMEGKGRKDLFMSFPPKVVYVSSSRIRCAKNGDFARMAADGGRAVAYAWFVWEKGRRQPTIIKWIN